MPSMTPGQRRTIERITGPRGLGEVTQAPGTTTLTLKKLIAPGDRFAVYSIAEDGSAQQHADELFINNPAWSTPDQLEAELAQQFPNDPIPCRDDTHPRGLLCMEFDGHDGSHRTYRQDHHGDFTILDEQW